MTDEEIATGVFRIYTFWKATMDLPRAKLTPERAKKIRERLKQGYSVEDIEKAIMGCHDSPFHRGDNERKTVYDDLTLICRNGSFLEKFQKLRRSLTAEEKANQVARVLQFRPSLEIAKARESQEDLKRQEEARLKVMDLQRRKAQAKGVSSGSLF
jgi:hypothetical protein